MTNEEPRIIKFQCLKTPKTIQFGNQKPLKEIEKILNEEFKNHNRWTDRCSDVLRNHPISLFQYDRFEFALGNAFGSHDFKLAINPMMVQCYHPKCIRESRKPVKLRHIYDLREYLDHLKDHSDKIGHAMQLRFDTVHGDHFVNKDHLDNLSVSPYVLMNPIPLASTKTVSYMNAFGIDRKLRQNYICHWKDKLLEENLINCSSLSFQEDDALIYLALHYPNPVRDWKSWNTIFFYCLKTFSSISSAALNLFRGITDHPRLSMNQPSNVQTFISQINHPGPSITSLQRFFPNPSYENETFHRSELIFHLKLLQKSTGCVSFKYDSITRYPVTLGIDEQEINQGTFIDNGVLHGLSKKLNVVELKQIGQNLPSHIAETNPFVSAVREYRLTDLKGAMCSNIYTSFEAGSMDSATCEKALNCVVNLANRCFSCALSNSECEYWKLNERCKNCEKKGLHCISLVVFFVLWDMGSAHKKTTKETSRIDSLSTNQEFMSCKLYSIGFGGLHLCKCCINSSRNHVMTLNGENYGANILRTLKNGDKCGEMLRGIKNAVFVGKDRQSDYLSYMTCCSLVQDALKSKKNYQMIRVPEKALSYTENTKTQKEFVKVTALKCNSNGDVFVLDSGASCIHVIDRSTVAKVVLIGKYRCPNNASYSSDDGNKFVKDIRLSSALLDMIFISDDLYIADSLRNEIIIVRNCCLANKVSSCRIFTIRVKGCLALSRVKDMLIVLKDDGEGGQVIKCLSLQFPKKGKNQSESFVLTTKTKLTITPSTFIKRLFDVNFCDNWFGSLTSTNMLLFFKVNPKVSSAEEFESTLISSIAPCTSSSTIVVKSASSYHLEKHCVTIKDENLMLNSMEELILETDPVDITQWGYVLYAVGVSKGEKYAIEESGPLNFGLKFCEAVKKFYDAITYLPPHGDQSLRRMNLEECINEGEALVSLLTEMQSSQEEKYTPRKSFMGPNGIPFSDTILCIRITVESWKALLKRINYLDPALINSIYPHTITNESLIEHSFGFTMKKGQGHLQSMQEYILSKRKHSMDFQLRLCDAPFNQYVKTKLRDKGYQHLNTDFCSKLEIKDLYEVFSSSANDADMEKPELTEDDQRILRTAFLLTKYVPRRSNRAKWREASGYHPNLLKEKELECGKLLRDDLVFFQSLDKSLYLKVQHDTLLKDKDTKVDVIVLNEVPTNHTSVKIDCLLRDKGMIFTIPPDLYSVVDEEVHLGDTARQMFEEICDANVTSPYSDEDWVLLSSSSTEEQVSPLDVPCSGENIELQI